MLPIIQLMKQYQVSKLKMKLMKSDIRGTICWIVVVKVLLGVGEVAVGPTEVVGEAVEGEAMAGDGAPMEVVEVGAPVAVAAVAVAVAMLVVAVEVALAETLVMVPEVLVAMPMAGAVVVVPEMAEEEEEVMVEAVVAVAVMAKVKEEVEVVHKVTGTVPGMEKAAVVLAAATAAPKDAEIEITKARVLMVLSTVDMVIVRAGSMVVMLITV